MAVAPPLMLPEEGDSKPPTFETLSVRTEGHVTHVLLNRPIVENAMNTLMLRELHDAVRFYGKHSPTRVLTFRGAGTCFSKGMDLKDLSPTTVINEILAKDDLDASRKGRALERTIHEAQKVFSALEEVSASPRTAHGDLSVRSRRSWRSTGSAKAPRWTSPQPVTCASPTPPSTFSSTESTSAPSRVFRRSAATPLGSSNRWLLCPDSTPKAPSSTGTKRPLNHAKEHSVSDSLRFAAVLSQSQNENKDIV
uniref:3-hydroxyisobutyryl-CoA hydrolase n=1 Tax=Steinernema glaseri TaxID=37863 RepID=A0A1I7ZML4_9BILA